MNVLYTPIQYTYFTFYSNIKTTRFYGVYFCYFLFIFIISFFSNNAPFSKLLSKKTFHAVSSFENQFSENNYENLRDQTKTRFIPTIQSDIIADHFIKLFIPKMARENEAIKTICGEWEKDENLSRNENNNAMQKFYNGCMDKYYSIYIDNQAVPNLSFQKYKTDFVGGGYICYIPIKDIGEGKHLLKIEQAYKRKDKNKISYISFWRQAVQ